MKIKLSQHRRHLSNIIHIQSKPQSAPSTIVNKSVKSTDNLSIHVDRKQTKNSRLRSKSRRKIQRIESNNSSEQTKIKTDHLQSQKNKKKETHKKCSRQRVIICLFTIIVVIILLTTLILIPLLNRKKKNDMVLLRWNREGITIAGTTNVSGKTANLLNYPYDLALDWSYSLYVTDRYNNRVQKFLRGSLNATTVAGRANGTSGSSTDALIQPISVLVDDDSNVYVSDLSNNRVMFWKNNATNGIIIAGNGTSGIEYNQLKLPHGLSCDLNTNTLFIADFSNNRVMMYRENASTGVLVGGNLTAGTSRTQLFSPQGIFYDQSPNSILIANTGAKNIVRWTLNEIEWSIIVGNSSGFSGNSSLLFNDPTDVMLDPMNNMYVVDRLNQRVQFFPAGQNIGITIIGVTERRGANTQLLNLPSSIALDNQLNLYISDAQNHRIQKFLRY